MTSASLKSKRQHLSFPPDERPCYAQRRPEEVVELRLPMPPSTNRLYRNKRGGAGRIKTEAYRAWRAEAEAEGNVQRPGRRIGASDVTVYLPDGKADTDNNIKPLLDAAVAIGVIADDKPRYVRNVALVRDSSREDCLLIFRPTQDIGEPHRLP